MIEYLNVLKVIACIGVMMIHFASKSPYSDNLWIQIAYYLPRISVSLFYFIGGILLYKNPEFSLKSSVKKFLYLSSGLIIFRFIYYIYFQEPSHFWNEALRDGYWHLWYMYTIIPIYTLSSILYPPRIKSQEEARIFVSIALLAILLFSTSSSSFPFYLVIPGTQNIFSTLTAFTFMLLGYGLDKLTLKKSPLYMIIALSSLYFYVVYCREIKFIENYGALHLLIAAIFTFFWIKYADIPIYLQQICNKLAPYTFHAYGWHALWIFVGRPYILPDFNLLKISVYFIFIVIMSFGTSLVTTPIHNYIVNNCIKKVFRRT